MSMRDLIPWSRQQQNMAPSLISERDWSPLSSFRREVDRLFDDMFRSPGFSGFGGGMMTGWPSIEVKDSDNEVLVTAEVPGMSEKDVELLLDNGSLTIRGEKKGERDERGYSERWYRALDLWHCPTCGCTTHWTPTDPAYPRMAVNLRMFDPALWSELPRRLIDGASY